MPVVPLNVTDPASAEPAPPPDDTTVTLVVVRVAGLRGSENVIESVALTEASTASVAGVVAVTVGDVVSRTGGGVMSFVDPPPQLRRMDNVAAGNSRATNACNRTGAPDSARKSVTRCWPREGGVIRRFVIKQSKYKFRKLRKWN